MQALGSFETSECFNLPVYPPHSITCQKTWILQSLYRQDKFCILYSHSSTGSFLSCCLSHSSSYTSVVWVLWCFVRWNVQYRLVFPLTLGDFFCFKWRHRVAPSAHCFILFVTSKPVPYTIGTPLLMRCSNCDICIRCCENIVRNVLSVCFTFVIDWLVQFLTKSYFRSSVYD
jgi:hypothetical protein